MSTYTYAIGVTHDLPVVSVAIPQASLTGNAGVLNHTEQNYEYEAVLTLIEDGEEKFSVPFGFRLHGNDSRKCPKQNFSLRFRSEYGAGKLNYRLFENRDIDEFDSRLLKGGSEDWGFGDAHDEAVSGIVNRQSGDYQLIKAVLSNVEGRDAFLKRCACLLNAVLNEERFISIIDSLAAAIESEMPRDRERWRKTVSHWEDCVQQLRDFVKDGARSKRILADVQSYFSLTDAQMAYYFGS